MKRSAMIIVIGAAAAIAFGGFVALAQAHAIFVPYFTPTRIEFQGLQDRYPASGSMSYDISVKGYGSNCIAFKAEVLREDNSLAGGQESVAYFNRIQDCRIINISQGPYNYSQSFSYGDIVLAKPGDYRVDVEVLDQITKQNHTDTRSFRVE